MRTLIVLWYIGLWHMKSQHYLHLRNAQGCWWAVIWGIYISWLVFTRPVLAFGYCHCLHLSVRVCLLRERTGVFEMTVKCTRLCYWIARCNPVTPVECVSLSFHTCPCVLAFITYILCTNGIQMARLMNFSTTKLLIFTYLSNSQFVPLVKHAI